MQVATYQGIVENGRVQLPAEAHIPEHAMVYVVVPGSEGQQVARIWSPRLVNQEDAKDFVKEVRPENDNAKI
jgi:hypothetical protein